MHFSSINYKRDGKENVANITLKNKVGNTDVVKKEGILDNLGAEFEAVDKKVAAANDISGGVVVKKIKEGGLLKATKMQEGFVITSINDEEIKSVDALKEALKNAKGGSVRLMGIYPGFQGTYAYPLTLPSE